jgi:hypothetical protein
MLCNYFTIFIVLSSICLLLQLFNDAVSNAPIMYCRVRSGKVILNYGVVEKVVSDCLKVRPEKVEENMRT